MELSNHAERAHAFLPASASNRWSQCPGSAKLAALYPPTDTAFTREGTLAHEVAEAVASGNTPLYHVMEKKVTGDGVSVKLEAPDPDMIRHAEAYRDYIDGLLQPGTTKMLEQRVDFSDWVPGGFGTADCILLHPDGCMDVIDYKYGQGVAVSAVGNPQMQLYGLGAMADYGFAYEVEKVRLHIFQPRKDNISAWETDADHLFQFGQYISGRAAAALGPDPELHAGDHCKFCPHAGHCPELASHCISAVTQGSTLCPEEPTKSLSADAVARLLSMEPMISAWLKKLKEQALADALAGKELPGYKLVEGKAGNRKWSDELKVAAALDAAGVPREDYTTLQLLSPAAMDKALGKKRAAELLAGLTERAPASPTLAPVSDKRKEYNRQAAILADFKEE